MTFTELSGAGEMSKAPLLPLASRSNAPLDGVLVPATASAAAASATPATKALSGNLASIDTVRLIAAVHIVYAHVMNADSFTKWGVSWVTFFFMLSGFGATHSKLSQGTVGAAGLLPQPRTLLRRLAAVYPTYLFALGWDIVNGAPHFFNKADGTHHWGRLWAEVVLAQSFYQTEHVMFSNVINGPAWFVSALALCWLLEEATAVFAAAAHRRFGLASFPLFFAAVVLWPFAGFPWLWGAYAPWGDQSAWVGAPATLASCHSQSHGARGRRMTRMTAGPLRRRTSGDSGVFLGTLPARCSRSFCTSAPRCPQRNGWALGGWRARPWLGCWRCLRWSTSRTSRRVSGAGRMCRGTCG